MAMLGVLSWRSLFALDPSQVAPVRPVTEAYFGSRVVDNYRYLENLKDPQVQAWMHSQANYTRTVLDGIPGRTRLLQRIHALASTDLYRGRIMRRGQRYFYLTYEPDAELPKLFYRDGLKGGEHLLVDPAVLGKDTGTHYSLDYYQPSLNGKYLAYGLSVGGSEQSILHVLDVATGKLLEEAIDRTSNSVIAWRADNRSFFYLRYNKPTPQTPPSETLFNGRTYLHTLGAPASGDADAVVFGRGVNSTLDVPEGQGTYIVLGADSPFAIAVANHNMDENPSTLYVAPLDKVVDGQTPWRKVASVEDGVSKIVLRGDQLYFLSQKGAPHFRVLATSLARPDVIKPRIVMPEGTAVLTDFTLAKEGFYVSERDGAKSRLLSRSFEDPRVSALALPFDGRLGTLVSDPRESGVLVSLQGWVKPPIIINYDPAAGTAVDTGLMPASGLDVSQLETKDVVAQSYDGTRIPLSIVYRKGAALDGTHPTILEGYGAYGISLDPYFDPTRLAWIEQGGVYAIAHIRGGGEFGEEWHQGGFKLTKTNTILDFVACAQFLIDARYTSSKYLAALGGSAGGITVGGALTWRPELFGVILDLVGMSDTLRSETEPNGPPNVSEFGSVSTAAGFHGLYAMDAYVHIADGVRYPAVLFSTGANDPRVASWHMTKMAARVQAATTGGRPVLLRIDYDAGHGIGSTNSQAESETADLWSFALWQMGEPEFQPSTRP